MKQTTFFRLMYRNVGKGWVELGKFPSKHLARNGAASWTKFFPETKRHFMIQKVIEVSHNMEHMHL